MRHSYRSPMINRSIISTAFTLSLTACAGGISENSTSAAANQVSTSSALVGRVTNSNGIRDDVNSYILATFPSNSKERTAAIRLARANQRVLEVITEGRLVTPDLVMTMSYAGLCFAQNMDKKSFIKQAREITARTFNTEERARAHDEFSKQAYGMPVATSAKRDACEAAK